MQIFGDNNTQQTFVLMKMSCRHFEDLCLQKSSSRQLAKTSLRRFQDVSSS